MSGGILQQKWKILSQEVSIFLFLMEQKIFPILPLIIKRTGMVLAGLSKAQMIDGIKAAYENQELPPPEPGAMCYMMSRAGYLNDALGHYVPHLMFYFPLTDKSSWGADLPDSPVTLNPQFQGGPEPITEFVIAVGKWSDGTPAPAM